MKQRFVLNTLVVLLAVVCLAAGNAMAQTEYLKGGTKALQFQIQRDFMLSSFDGSTISLKKQSSSDRAWRVGLTVDASGYSNDQSNESTSGTTSSLDEDVNTQNFRLSLQKVFYTHAANRAFAYFGLGPVGSFSRSKRDRTLTSPVGSISENEDLTRNWSVGLGGSIGVEWFAARNISLLAEYNNSATIAWRKQKSESRDLNSGVTSTQEADRTTYSLNDDGVRFGLAVYF
jgi:hypothetical protein